MATLPLPSGSSLAGGDLPVSTTEDILAVFPRFVKVLDNAVVRDAIIAALTAMMENYQNQSDNSVQMSDVLAAVDSALTGLGADRGIFKAEGEADEDYRTRIISIPEVITPTAIIDIVNNLLAPFTTIESEYCESILDRWYVGTSDARSWHSYVFDDTTDLNPGYKDRLYTEYAADNFGYSRSNSSPCGARVFSDEKGRCFLIRIPDLSGIENLGAFPGSTDIPSRFYVGGVGVASPVRKIGTTVTDLFNKIITTVDSIKAHSIRYILFMDPKLVR